jgi:hypothetical protein
MRSIKSGIAVPIASSARRAARSALRPFAVVVAYAHVGVTTFVGSSERLSRET